MDAQSLAKLVRGIIDLSGSHFDDWVALCRRQ